MLTKTSQLSSRKTTDHKISPPLLGSALLSAQLLTEAHLQIALANAQKANQSLLIYLLQHHSINPCAISKACAQYFGLEHRELTDFDCDTLPVSVINKTMIGQRPVLPLIKDSQKLWVAVCDPEDFSLLEDIQYQTGMHTQAVMAPYDQLTSLINTFLASSNYSQIQTSAVSFIEQIITDAIHRNASDIHFEPLANHVRVRLRIDGLLHEITQASTELSSPIISRLKILAECDIAERRLPQDGRFHFTTLNGHRRDCRLNCIPTIYGEKIVVRLLDSSKKILAFSELGMTVDEQNLFQSALSQPQGLILVTGPTGSGKTITLYTALEYLNRTILNLYTIEEPVEIQLKGINQINIHEKIGLTFASVLRALLRQDPDIIMVGEIRDKETAEIAIRAAQTGHLVLSTLHTNSAAETLTRLLNMGIAPFNLANSLRLIAAQRLIRKLCPHCKKKINENFEAQGCHYCTQGYYGREGIFEIMAVSKTLSSLFSDKNTNNLIAQAQLEGMTTLWNNAQLKMKQGITSLAEISRVVSP